jgi:hypothetical protein
MTIHLQEQFMFIHDTILESVTCGDTQISATNLKVTITKMKKSDDKNQPHGFKYQFKVRRGMWYGVVTLIYPFADLGAGFS